MSHLRGLNPGLIPGLIAVALLCPCTACGWGERTHGVINRTAIDTLPDDGPVYLKARKTLITRSAT
ncbi:hypothetical protein [Asaia krungthepensis]|uniref:Uncharacterized protein n=1 Tax=Asaia krungthepensis NRIC 0535 TaxID=1307925 RepID=A0ABQ0PYF6_9PROT|nr:hypothetical protein [Asaia krungthepensis]GBQ84701.1 hypothetical protein AA0535_0571 [Asaia krungthepensis NRIC 0535]